VGGANAGITAFELRGDHGKTFHLKQARSNVGPALLQASSMRESIDCEFAAFSFYRLVETHRPEMLVHMRDCAKVSVDVSLQDPSGQVLAWSLKCMLFEHIDALKPVWVAWEMLPPRWMAPLKPSTKATVTTEELVARWRVTAQPFTDEDAARATAFLGAGRRHDIHRHLATQFAITALRGVAADAILANVYGWGVFDKPQFSYCPDDSSSLDSGGKMYRMSADSTLGTLGYGTEPLNDDRCETEASLGHNTFMDAAFDLPFFRKRNGSANNPVNSNGMRDANSPTFTQATGNPLLSSVRSNLLHFASSLLSIEWRC